ncbi:glycosyltransferase [Enterococcus sp. AZ102]|uniref:glycosyltransferase n=1 Tax=Enterococcus sp. AZ102 TaxID=2774865 RepID=UPI003F201DC8
MSNDLVYEYDISISIVAYHSQKDIKKAVETIEKYTSQNISKKIFILDNGNTPQEYSDIIKNNVDVAYINLKDNLGFGKAHNYLLNKENSRYHLILNPDVYFEEDVFSKLIVEMEQMPQNEKIVLVPKITDESNQLQMVYREHITLIDIIVRVLYSKFKIFKKRYNKHTLTNQNYERNFEVPFAQGSFLFMHTEFFNELKGFDDRYFMYLEDADLCKRIWKEHGKIIYCANTTVVHKWEKGSHKNLKLANYHINSMIKYFKKWGIN